MNTLLIGPLQIEILNRAVSNSDDYWDGNWLDIKVRVCGEDSRVAISGPLIHLSELRSFLRDLERVNRTLSGKAILKCMEPYLYVELQIGPRGDVVGLTKISSESLTEKHEFQFNADQTLVNPLIATLKQTLDEFPIKGSPS